MYVCVNWIFVCVGAIVPYYGSLISLISQLCSLDWLWKDLISILMVIPPLAAQWLFSLNIAELFVSVDSIGNTWILLMDIPWSLRYLCCHGRYFHVLPFAEAPAVPLSIFSFLFQVQEWVSAHLSAWVWALLNIGSRNSCCSLVGIHLQIYFPIHLHCAFSGCALPDNSSCIDHLLFALFSSIEFPFSLLSFYS